MRKRLILAAICVGLSGFAGLAAVPLAGQAPADGKLILWGDLVLFAGPNKPDNCTLRNRYKRGDPVGFRMSALDSTTGQPEGTAELVVHLSYGGKTEDLPMRYRAQNGRNADLWTAKWMVPADAPTGIVRYTVTGKDKNGRAGEWKPFANDLSQLTIAE